MRVSIAQAYALAAEMASGTLQGVILKQGSIMSDNNPPISLAQRSEHYWQLFQRFFAKLVRSNMVEGIDCNYLEGNRDFPVDNSN